MVREVCPCGRSKYTTWLDSLEDLSAPRRWLMISGMYIFQCYGCRTVVDFTMNGFSSFSGNLFAILVFYLKLGDVGLGVDVGNAVLSIVLVT